MQKNWMLTPVAHPPPTHTHTIKHKENIWFILWKYTDKYFMESVKNGKI